MRCLQSENWSHEAPLERTMFEILLFCGGVAVGVICDEAIRAIWRKVKARGESAVDRVRNR